MNLGNNILELRKTQNITQDALAAELGVTAAAVSKWENNYTLPDVLMLCALADFFQVSTDTLLGRDPKPFCAAIATSSLPLAEQIRELLQKRSFLVKHIVYGSFADAMEAISKDKSITHLFVSFDKPIGEYDKSSNPDLRIVESHSETPEMVLQGFAFYLSNMSSMDALAQAEKDMV